MPGNIDYCTLQQTIKLDARRKLSTRSQYGYCGTRAGTADRIKDNDAIIRVCLADIFLSHLSWFDHDDNHYTSLQRQYGQTRPM